MAATIRRVAAATLILTTLLVGGRPAGAATAATATSVVSGALGARRAVAWNDGAGTIYLQRLKTDGTPDGKRIEIRASSPEDSFTVRGPFAVAVGTDAIAVAYWYRADAHGASQSAVMAVVYDDGHIVETTNCTSYDSESAPPPSASVAWNGSVFFLVGSCPDTVVQDPRGYHLATATYDPVTSDQTFFDDDQSGSAGSVSSAAIGSGFIAAWHQIGVTSDLDVFAQRFSAVGYPTTNPTSVATGPGDQSQPTVATSGGKSLIAWIQGTGHDVAGRILSGTTLGTKKTLVNAAGNQNHPWLASSSNGGWHLAWSDLRAGNNDVYSAHILSTLTVSPVNGQLVAGGSGAQQAPTVSPLPNGRGYVAFIDQNVGKVRDLTAVSSPTGSPTTVTVSPK